MRVYYDYLMGMWAVNYGFRTEYFSTYEAAYRAAYGI